MVETAVKPPGMKTAAMKTAAVKPAAMKAPAVKPAAVKAAAVKAPAVKAPPWAPPPCGSASAVPETPSMTENKAAAATRARVLFVRGSGSVLSDLYMIISCKPCAGLAAETAEHDVELVCDESHVFPPNSRTTDFR